MSSGLVISSSQVPNQPPCPRSRRVHTTTRAHNAMRLQHSHERLPQPSSMRVHDDFNQKLNNSLKLLRLHALMEPLGERAGSAVRELAALGEDLC